MNYFITENYIKEKTPITSNIDVKLINPYINTASDMRIKKAIGTYFYNILLGKYNTQTLSVNETTLVSYIQPTVAWYAAVDCVLGLSYQLKNKGLQQQSSDYSTNVELKVVDRNSDYYLQKANFYESELSDFLILNGNLYPDYESKNNIDSSIKNKCNLNNDGLYGFMIV